MTDKEKLEKIKALADKMYSRMAYLTSDTRPIRQAMDEYHQFIINEYHKEEPVSEDLEKVVKDYRDKYWYPDDIDKFMGFANHIAQWQKQKDESYTKSMYKVGINTGKELMKQQMLAKAVEGGCFSYKNGFVHISCDIDEHITNIKFGDKIKVIVIKED